MVMRRDDGRDEPVRASGARLGARERNALDFACDTGVSPVLGASKSSDNRNEGRMPEHVAWHGRDARVTFKCYAAAGFWLGREKTRTQLRPERLAL